MAQDNLPPVPYGRQNISRDDIDSVISVLTSDFLTQGPAVPRFEAAVCKATGAAHAVAMNSATSALHVACLALGLGKGDLLWTSPVTFVASANVGHLCGADVDFVDIDPVTFNMCPKRLDEKLKQAKALGRLPKVVMPVHMCGQSCDMEAISALAKSYGVKVVEDASHAIGGIYRDQAIGACAHSDIAVFSFHPVKIVTTAEGGCATTQNGELAAQMARLRSHGVTRDDALMDKESEGGWYYQQIELGLNYRMTDMQAALGASQMQRLENFVEARQAHAARYDDQLADLPLTCPTQRQDSYSAYHLYVIQVDPERRRAVFDFLRARGILVNVHYIPVHLQPYWRAFGFGPGDFPAAEAYYASAISIPLFAQMTTADQDRVIAALHEVLA